MSESDTTVEEKWDPDIPRVSDQLALVSKRLCARMEELELTPRIIQARSGLALNSVKTAMTGKTCNINTLAEVCAAMKWSLFDAFQIGSNESNESHAQVKPEPLTYQPPQSASSILD